MKSTAQSVLPAVSQKITLAYVPPVIQLPSKTRVRQLNLVPPRSGAIKGNLAQGWPDEALARDVRLEVLQQTPARRIKRPAKFGGLHVP